MSSSELRQYDFSKYKVLAIDDNEDSLLLLVEIFKHCGAAVIGSSNGWIVARRRPG